MRDEHGVHRPIAESKRVSQKVAGDGVVRSSFFLHPLYFILLLAIAVVPRVYGLADFFTTDEAYHWVDRVAGWSYAISKGRWAETILTGHPGVTIMWLGSLGQWLEQFALGSGWIGQPTALEHLAWLRLPSATLEALAVPLAYLMLRRILRPSSAFVAALLWATSPYLIAHSRLLHLDALLTTCITFSLLALLMQTKNNKQTTKQTLWTQSFGFLSPASCLLSAICGGLALLTKGPALILLPCIGLLLFLLVRAPSLWRRFVLAVGLFLGWMAIAGSTIVLLWPALWVAPRPAITRYIEEITSNGGRPNGDGQFFLGRAVQDPGPLFYPVANLFRSTPEMLLGLILFVMWAVGLLVAWRRGAELDSDQRSQARAAFVLGCFVCFWTLIMTLGPKKFDRYVLPTWPALLILAAIGLAWGFDSIRKRLIAHRSLQPIALTLLGAITIIPLAVYHPYYLSYYNPLLGGGATAQRALLIGWGEGLDQVGAYLATRPDIGHAPIISPLGATLRPFVSVPVENVDYLGRGNVNYAVVYLESLQRAAFPEAYAAIQRTVPLKRIRIHGIDYAAIYQVPKPFAQPLDAQFGDALHLWGVTIERSEGKLTVTPSWDVRAGLGGDYTLFMHLLDAQGNKVAQLDAPPAGDGQPTSAWQPGEQIAVPFELFPPSPLAPGKYDLVMGLYDATGTRLPLNSGPPADAVRAGSDALLVQTIEIQ